MKPEIIDPENKKPIRTIWAWLSKDALGREGIISCGTRDPNTGMTHHVPLVTGDENNVANFQKIADGTVRYTDKKIIRAKFVRVDE